MTPNDLASLRADLARLRRRCNLLTMLLISVAVLGVMASWRADDRSRVLEAGGLKLFDAEGRLYAEFGASDSGESIGLSCYDPQGRKRVQVFTSRHKGSIGDPGVWLIDAKNHGRLGLTCHDHPTVSLHDDNLHRLSLYAEGTCSGLLLRDKFEKAVLHIWQNDGVGAMSIDKPDGLPVWSAPPKPQAEKPAAGEAPR